MLRSLSRKLTLIFGALTVMVLGIAMAVTCKMAVNQYRVSTDLLLSRTFTVIEDAITGKGSISDSWLARQEAAAISVIHIEDGGVPLAFSGARQEGIDREKLIAGAKEQAKSAGLGGLHGKKQRVSFDLPKDRAGRSYRCMAAAIPYKNITVALYVIQDNTTAEKHILLMGWQYLGLWCIGSLALLVICRFAVGRALKPTEEAMLRQREFVAAAGHELRSPLTVVKAAVEAAEGQGLPEKAAGYLRTADSEIDRMAALTGDLLMLARGDAASWRATLRPLGLDTFLIELYDGFSLVARRSGHPFELLLPEGPLPGAMADGERLKQLLTVLLNNAVEHTEKGTAIELAAFQNKNAAVIEVRDHGEGIPDSEKKRVFDRFYRAEQSHTDKRHFGLGLSVAKELAALHGAELTVCDTLGGGATFRLKLPAIREK
ncbi:MAG: HAMP domain-containing sensor histidine kinase [Eubacteriales bacterium]|nr:HAMP domain-containing sensor histidine kinase [Eubacteriales bacterium]